MTNDPEVDEIRRRMSTIRRDMHVNFQTAVQSAERMFDWKAYVTSYPWIAIALAAGAGFVVAPGRRRHPVEATRAAANLSPLPTLTKVAGQTPIAIAGGPREAQPKSKRNAAGELMGLAFGLVAPVAIRAAQSYTISAIERWIETNLEPAQASKPQPRQEKRNDAQRVQPAQSARSAGSL